MPPAQQYTKETILKEAFAILQQEGLDAVSARSIAKNLGSSTQPVYSAYASMDELKKDLIARARAFATDYLVSSGQNEEPFLDIGMQYLRFAQEQREIFHLLFLSGQADLDVTDPFSPPALIDHMRGDVHLDGLDEGVLKRLLSNMSIYTFGLAVLVYSAKDIPEESILRERLYRMGGIMIAHELACAKNAAEGKDEYDAFQLLREKARKGDKNENNGS